jgi:hypothetical protein
MNTQKEGSSEVASTLLKQLEQRQLLLDDGGRGKWNGKAKQERVDRDFFSVTQLRSGKIYIFIAISPNVVKLFR